MFQLFLFSSHHNPHSLLCRLLGFFLLLLECAFISPMCVVFFVAVLWIVCSLDFNLYEPALFLCSCSLCFLFLYLLFEMVIVWTRASYLPHPLLPSYGIDWWCLGFDVSITRSCVGDSTLVVVVMVAAIAMRVNRCTDTNQHQLC